jgi:hypothetical protein
LNKAKCIKPNNVPRFASPQSGSKLSARPATSGSALRYLVILKPENYLSCQLAFRPQRSQLSDLDEFEWPGKAIAVELHQRILADLR